MIGLARKRLSEHMELSFSGVRDLLIDAAYPNISKAVAASCTPRTATGESGMILDMRQSLSRIRLELEDDIMESGSDSNTALAQSETIRHARGFVTSVLAIE